VGWRTAAGGFTGPPAAGGATGPAPDGPDRVPGGGAADEGAIEYGTGGGEKVRQLMPLRGLGLQSAW
jgi:hypothetical protein